MAMYPLVSAVMITGKSPDRLPMAQAAVASFLDQTYIASELVIINDGAESVLTPQLRGVKLIREYRVDRGHDLGSLRNLGLVHARGDWIIQWDDDDFYHPERIATQFQAAVPGKPVLLKRQVRYSFTTNSAYEMDWSYPSVPGIPGTILHPNDRALLYRHEGKGEDEYFIQDNFDNDAVVIDNFDNPHLYLRFSHGSNTWDEQHIMGRRMPNTWQLSPASRSYLAEVLAKHYGDLLTATLPDG